MHVFRSDGNANAVLSSNSSRESSVQAVPQTSDPSVAQSSGRTEIQSSVPGLAYCSVQILVTLSSVQNYPSLQSAYLYFQQ